MKAKVLTSNTRRDLASSCAAAEAALNRSLPHPRSRICGPAVGQQAGLRRCRKTWRARRKTGAAHSRPRTGQSPGCVRGQMPIPPLGFAREVRPWGPEEALLGAY
jgi:hypothetical protein